MKSDDIVIVGKKYLIIYDDKGNSPKKKEGVVVKVQGVLFTLNGFYDGKEFTETLNMNNIIRMEER
jgi:hypothetical protein